MAIRAKIFDYLAANRPVLAFVKDESDAAWLLRQTSAARIVGREELERVIETLVGVWTAWRRGELEVRVNQDWLAQFHRKHLTGRLAGILSEAAETSIPAVG